LVFLFVCTYARENTFDNVYASNSLTIDIYIYIYIYLSTEYLTVFIFLPVQLWARAVVLRIQNVYCILSHVARLKRIVWTPFYALVRLLSVVLMSCWIVCREPTTRWNRFKIVCTITVQIKPRVRNTFCCGLYVFMYYYCLHKYLVGNRDDNKRRRKM